MPTDGRDESVRRRARATLTGLGPSRPLSLPENDEIRLNFAAILIGVVAGLGAIAFRITIWIFLPC